ncbi:hypothetical protein [Pelagerythrobacter marinus]|uniref:hypothetical protein n=1 Tax=Pelagerythrobacter marinus TaxID=538382 RepID=UPI0020370023|nr:hypothetical protein [Pelagerythrobacter marinus]USA38944.1 hypothetical protein NCF86_11605 [Pelagerythrobacter marinus]WPZ06973.1 hypothetical protein T8T98_00210 [Pelagerythrobacter marinus]
MTIPSSRALVPVAATAERSSNGAEASCSAGIGRRRKWMLALGVVLALAALALGSIWLGFAAILPFLYVLPCLAMVAMCMRKSGTSTGS